MPVLACCLVNKPEWSWLSSTLPGIVVWTSLSDLASFNKRVCMQVSVPKKHPRSVDSSANE